MEIKTALFVGDLHCGGYYGLWPEEYLGSSGVRDWSGTRYLNQCWQHMLADVDRLVPGGVDATFLMGDLIEGKNYKAQAVGLHTAALGEQAKGAIKLLQPVRERSKVMLRVDGTPYHEGFDGALGELDVALGISRKAQVFDVQLPGGILNVAHHPAGGSALYQGTKLDKEAVWSSVAAARGQVPTARWIVRAHLHNFAVQHTATKTVLLMPCWKLADFYAKKGNYWAWQPDIGAVLMVADEYEAGGYRFIPLLYPPLVPEVLRPEQLTFGGTTEGDSAAA